MSPDQYRAKAQALAGAGDPAGARRVLEGALAEHPDNAALFNSAGNMAMKVGDREGAETFFARAAELSPTSVEYATNRAIALAALERHREALATLAPLEAAGSQDARYCSVRANSARGVGDMAQAESWYDRSLTLAPAGAKAAHGRARVALERGARDAVARFERALSLNQSDPEAWLGLTQALEAAGETARARGYAEQLVAQAPHWIAALRLLAQIRLAAGESDFASHFAEAERKLPADPAVARAHVQVLDNHDLFDEALAVAAAAHARIPGDPGMALLEAAQASAVGQDERAEAIYAALDLDTPDRWLQEARHRLHLHQLDRAETLLARVLEVDPDHISAWALRGLGWRMAGDERSKWLHSQENLVQLQKLPDADAVLAEVVPLLHHLHDEAAFPLGQSLRGGTQTRGNLFDRAEPELARLHAALAEALENYRAALPPADPDHPLLRHRDAPWRITGSWSVRLSAGGDYHAAHLHPQGLISSASYLVLPADLGEGEAREGWIELGRPAPDLGLDLEPLYQVQPKLGHLALFPSTLYHGTRPFADGQRMTVAIDITVDDSPLT